MDRNWLTRFFRSNKIGIAAPVEVGEFSPRERKLRRQRNKRQRLARRVMRANLKH
jgi:polynucleotide 5'-kinase involved in rRNA processing